jgi:hypothetical protein
MKQSLRIHDQQMTQRYEGKSPSAYRHRDFFCDPLRCPPTLLHRIHGDRERVGARLSRHEGLDGRTDRCTAGPNGGIEFARLDLCRALHEQWAAPIAGAKDPREVIGHTWARSFDVWCLLRGWHLTRSCYRSVMELTHWWERSFWRRCTRPILGIRDVGRSRSFTIHSTRRVRSAAIRVRAARTILREARGRRGPCRL